MSPKAGGGGWGVSANEYSYAANRMVLQVGLTTICAMTSRTTVYSIQNVNKVGMFALYL
jgi:hypothetical protein